MEYLSLTHLDIVQKPQDEPVSTQDAMDWVHAASSEENKMRFLVRACRSRLERLLGIAFYTQTLQATYEFAAIQEELYLETPARERMTFTLPRPPLQDIQTVEVETDIDVFTPIDEAEYELIRQFPAQIHLYGGVFSVVEEPWWLYMNRDPRVRVIYRCGYDDIEKIPEDYLLLLLQMIADAYLQREGGALSPELASTLAAHRVLVL